MLICNGEAPTVYLRNGNKPADLKELPRCQAIAANGQPCKRAARKGQKYCGIHGGFYKPGPEIYNRPALKHGLHSKEARQEQEQIRNVIRFVGELTSAINFMTKNNN